MQNNWRKFGGLKPINNSPKDFMGKIYNNIVETVGHTPLVKLIRSAASKIVSAWR